MHKQVFVLLSCSSKSIQVMDVGEIKQFFNFNELRMDRTNITTINGASIIYQKKKSRARTGLLEKTVIF